MVKHNFTENILLAADTENVCWCANITKGQVLAAIANGAKNLADIQNTTGACKAALCNLKNPRGR